MPRAETKPNAVKEPLEHKVEMDGDYISISGVRAYLPARGFHNAHCLLLTVQFDSTVDCWEVLDSAVAANVISRLYVERGHIPSGAYLHNPQPGGMGWFIDNHGVMGPHVEGESYESEELINKYIEDAKKESDPEE